MTKAKATLSAHGTRRAPEEVILSAPAPDFTPTWRPFSHGTVVHALGAACEKQGLAVTNKEYSISKSMRRMFGVWEVEYQKDKDISCAIGFRNSIDKHFAVGLCAGERVYVCDNLIFDSTFVMFRKHTGALTEDELVFIASQALKAVLPRFDALKRWHESLKGVGLTDEQASLITVAAMKREIIPPVKYPEFYNHFFANDGRYSDSHNLHGWHGAVTEMMLDSQLGTIQRKNSQLNQFIRYEVPQYLEKHTKPIIFEEVETRAQKKADGAIAERQAKARLAAKDIRKQVRKERRAKKAAAKKGAREGYRVALTMPVGPLPEGHQIDYACGLKLKSKGRKAPAEPTEKKRGWPKGKPRGPRKKAAKSAKIREKTPEKAAAEPRLLLDLPEWHNDAKKSLDFVANMRRKSGAIRKVIVRKYPQGFLTELYGSKNILRTFGFALGGHGKGAKALFRILSDLKIGKFNSVFSYVVKNGQGLQFSKGKAKSLL